MGRKSNIQKPREANLRGWRGFKTAEGVNSSDAIGEKGIINSDSGRESLGTPVLTRKAATTKKMGSPVAAKDQALVNDGSFSGLLMATGVQGMGTVVTSGLMTAPTGPSGMFQTSNLFSGLLLETEDDIASDKEEEGNVSVENKGAPSFSDIDNLLQLEKDDVVDEIDFWKQAVMCRILGANPPWAIIEGIVRRIWAKYDIDKISFLQKRVFLVRFKSMEMQEQVLQSGHYLFDNKPLLVKPWSKDLDLKLDALQVVPAWIQLHNVPLKCWGKGLPKIASLVGKFVKRDAATEGRTRLGYARVLVEMKLDQHFPDKIAFKDENGSVVRVQVVYEWRPSC